MTPKSFAVRQIMVFTPPEYRETMQEFLQEFYNDWRELAMPRGGDPSRRSLNPEGVWMYDVPITLNPDVKRILLELSEDPFWVVFED